MCSNLKQTQTIAQSLAEVDRTFIAACRQKWRQTSAPVDRCISRPSMAVIDSPKQPQSRPRARRKLVIAETEVARTVSEPRGRSAPAAGRSGLDERDVGGARALSTADAGCSAGVLTWTAHAAPGGGARAAPKPHNRYMPTPDDPPVAAPAELFMGRRQLRSRGPSTRRFRGPPPPPPVEAVRTAAALGAARTRGRTQPPPLPSAVAGAFDAGFESSREAREAAVAVGVAPRHRSLATLVQRTVSHMRLIWDGGSGLSVRVPKQLV
jgi:hypothetical protein